MSIRLLSAFLCVLCSSLPLLAEKAPNTLAPGTKWETPFFVINGENPGPTVVITGGIHGDEPAGAQAAEQIRHWPLRSGRLIVIPRVNAPGLEEGTRRMPAVEKPHNDLNRNFPKTKAGAEPHGELAMALWKLVEAEKPDWVIDLHEGYHFHQIHSKSVGSSIIDVKGEAADAVVPAMLQSVNESIEEKKKRFTRLRYPVDDSLARAAHERLGATAMILETTTREQRLSRRTRQHRLMVHTLFSHLGMIAADAPNLIAPPARPGTLRVAVYDAAGTATSGPKNLRAIFREMKGTTAWQVGSEDIGEGTLKGFDLVVFPGGSGSKIAAAIGENGRREVKKFVDDGGGYLGVCAGAYLAAANYKWSLGISNHKTFCEMREIPEVGRKSMWYRGGSSTVQMELTDSGREILGDMKAQFPVRYHNGPIVSPAAREGLPGFEVLAHFRSEVSKYETQKGTMVDTPAIIAAEFGKGRVLCISPHPESSKELRPMVAKGIRWAAGKLERDPQVDKLGQ